MFPIERFALMTVASLVIVKAAPSGESTKNVTSGGRCIKCALEGAFKGIEVLKDIVDPHHKFHPDHSRWANKTVRASSASCPSADVSIVTDRISNVKSDISVIINRISAVESMRKSVKRILDRLDSNRGVVERVMETHSNRVLESITTDITDVKRTVEKVQTNIITDRSCSGGGGDVSRLKSSLDGFSDTFKRFVHSEKDTQDNILNNVEDTLRKLGKIKKYITTISSSDLADGSSDPVKCSDSPGIVDIENTNRQILQKIKTALTTVTGNSQQIKSVVQNVSVGSQNQSDVNRIMSEITVITENFNSLRNDVSGLKISIAERFAELKTEFKSRSDVLPSFQFKASTQAVASSAAAAAMKEVRRVGSRGLCAS